MKQTKHFYLKRKEKKKRVRFRQKTLEYSGRRVNIRVNKLFLLLKFKWKPEVERERASVRKTNRKKQHFIKQPPGENIMRAVVAFERTANLRLIYPWWMLDRVNARIALIVGRKRKINNTESIGNEACALPRLWLQVFASEASNSSVQEANLAENLFELLFR